jgi:hypothetical protein
MIFRKWIINNLLSIENVDYTFTISLEEDPLNQIYESFLFLTSYIILINIISSSRKERVLLYSDNQNIVLHLKTYKNRTNLAHKFM